MLFDFETSTAQNNKNTEKTNPQLVKFHEQFSPARLIKVSERTWVAFGYSYSNFSFIDTDEGIIVVDAGWFPKDAESALAAFRKINQKPIIALIYTHLHTDHFGGSQVFLKNNKDIAIYAPFGWDNWVNYSSNVLNPMVTKRGYSQMGIILPSGDEGTVGAGIGIAPRISGQAILSPPNHIISKDTSLVIGGLKIQLMLSAGDIQENLMVFLTDEKTLLCGDIIGGTFPFIETARYEPDRKPADFIVALDKSITLNPKNIVPGHGRVLLGENDVKDVLESNKDIIQFAIDQINRAIINGLSPDEIIDQLKFPKKLADHADLQAYYHKIDWIIRQMYVKSAGFVGSDMDLAKLTKKEEAIRLAKLLGGEMKMLQKAQKAFDEKDYRWAASLTDQLLSISKSNSKAIELRQKSFKAIAEITKSAPERNYLLTAIKVEKEGLNWSNIIVKSTMNAMQRSSNKQIIELLPARFVSEKADDVNLVISITINKEPTRYFRIRNNVLFTEKANGQVTDVEIQTDRSTLISIVSRNTRFSEEAINGNLIIKKGTEKAKTFFDLIE